MLYKFHGSRKKSSRKKNPSDPKPNPIPNLTLTLPLTHYWGLFSGEMFSWHQASLIEKSFIKLGLESVKARLWLTHSCYIFKIAKNKASEDLNNFTPNRKKKKRKRKKKISTRNKRMPCYNFMPFLRSGSILIWVYGI